MTERLDAEQIIDGRYRIEHRLGSGGMADVYCATDLQLGRRIALKVLYRRFAQDQEFVERFRREASAAAGLQHKHVVSVYDRGEWDGTYYIAMEYLEGQTLKAIIRREAPLDTAVAVDYAIQVLKAARFAHRHGVIHRDLKPQNVMIDDEGNATVTDFGIARAGSSEMTQTGSIMGTAQYLSPEQAQGHAVSAQSDLYSVGIILYEMLAGRLPFDGESAVAIAMKQVGEAPVPPSSLNPAVAPGLEAVVLQALAKDPRARFPDADAFIAALRETENGASYEESGSSTIIAPPYVPPPVYGHPPPADWDDIPVDDDGGPGKRWWIFAAVALLVVGAVIAGLLLTRTEQSLVPGVVGQPQAAAEQQLQEAGFQTEAAAENSEKPKGQVIRQTPAANTQADDGSTVQLTISDGPGTAPVPAVAGLSQSQATNRLKGAGFKPRVSKRSSDDVPKGDAIGTSPGENVMLERGQTVVLYISSGKAQVVVPNVVGQAIADARDAITNAKLTVGAVTEKEDATAAPGTVLSQNPPGDGAQKAPLGSAVALLVAKAPSQVEVPDVTGDDEATADDTLTAAGFKVVTKRVDVPTEDQDGTVFSQDPAGGKAKPGSTVTIGVGRYNPPAETLPPDTGAADGTQDQVTP